jgi:cytochrome c553
MKRSNDNKKTQMNRLLIFLVAASALIGLTAQAADAPENWKAHCAKCHGPDGKGDTKMGKKAGCKDMTDAKVQADIKDDKAFKSLKEGLKDGDKTLMQAYSEKLSDDEIKALIAHVRSLKK